MIIIFIHGLGYSSQSFVLLQQSLTKLDSSLKFFSYDLPLHGSSTDTLHDLSLSSLTSQLLELLTQAYGTQESKKEEFILVGHSLGGSIAVSIAPYITQFGRLVGIVLLDIVGGTAIESLTRIQETLSRRPLGFNSLEEAIQWNIDSGTIRNLESARISVPSCLIDLGIQGNEEKIIVGKKSRMGGSRLGALMEGESSSGTMSSQSYRFIWKVDILKTEQFWSGWFDSLSTSFLAVKCPKLLILANPDRLDTPTTIAEMSGRIQLHIMKGGVGHLLHEDDPNQVAQIMLNFLGRIGISSEEILRRVKKVGQI